MAKLLTEPEVAQRLGELPDWKRDGVELVKEFRFSEYLKGAAFVSQLAQAAEEMNHHPDMLVRWRKVEVRLSTHSEGGLTELDFELARKAESIYALC